jgi:hypothetical protein
MTAQSFIPKIKMPGASRGKMLVYIVFALAGFLLIALLILVIWLLTKDRNNNNITSELSITPTPEITDVYITDIPISESTKFIYLAKTDNSTTSQSKIKLMDVKSNTSEELSPAKLFYSLYSISPDNKKIIAGITNSAKKIEYYLYEVDQKIFSKIEIDNLLSLNWVSESKINIFYKNTTAKSYEVITYDTTKKDFTLAISIPLTIGSYPYISNDLKYIITSDASQDLYKLTDLSTKITYSIDSLNLTSGYNFNPLLWNSDDKFIFYSQSGIFELNPVYLRSDQIVGLRSENEILSISGFNYHPDKKSLLFSLDNIVYFYKFSSETITEVLNNNDISDLKVMSINGNGVNYFLMLNYDGSIYNFNIKNSKLSTICGKSCTNSSPVWLN